MNTFICQMAQSSRQW